MKIGQIYSLICPISNKVRYVGQTTQKLNRRLASHKYSTKYNIKKGYKLNHKNCWINSLIEKNLQNLLKIELIEEINFDSISGGFDYMDEREIYWIKYYKDLNFDLTNTDPGGKINNIGKSHKMRKILDINIRKNSRPMVSSETKHKISVANSGENNGMYGKKFKRTKEQKEKLQQSLLNSDKLKESRKSIEFRNKISEIQSKAIYILNMNFDIVGEFKNTIECAESLGYTKNNIGKAVQNLRKIGKSKLDKYWVVRKENYEESINTIKMR